MLISLEIKGLAVIEEARIELHPGLNVLTGETGTGKSVLIKALSLLGGGKASADVIRSDRKQASVTGLFQIRSDDPCLEILAGAGIPLPQADARHPDALILRRVIRDSGRSSAWINDVSVTVATLKKIGESVIDIFAQHDNQRLLDESSHLHHLDSFLTDTKARRTVQELWKESQAILKKIKSFHRSYREHKKSQDYIQFRLQELEELDPDPQDYKALVAYCRQAEQSLAIRRQHQEALEILERGYQTASLTSGLWKCSQILSHKAGEQAFDGEKNRSWSDRLSTHAKDLDELMFEIGREESRIQEDEHNFEASQQRLARYQSVMRKLQCDNCEELTAERTRLREVLDFIENAKQTMAEMLDGLLSKAKKLKKACDDLSWQRREVAGKLEGLVAAEFSELAMPAARLNVDISRHQAGPLDPDTDQNGEEFSKKTREVRSEISRLLSGIRQEGQDRVRFLMVTNKGEQPRPLARIASGGEVSRVMLAMKRVLSFEKKTCVLVFDEIDTGISGRVASKVGQKLREMSREAQVICISHLAQVAAWAGAHYRVRKRGSDRKTWVELSNPLSEQEKTKELARLLSGEKVTPVSMKTP